MKDTLFTLAPGFEDNGRREYCPECAEIAGLLAYYPAIKDGLEIVHVSIEHPRAAITALLGDGRYNAPTLLLAESVDAAEMAGVKQASGRYYLDSARTISAYWRQRYGIAARRGD